MPLAKTEYKKDVSSQENELTKIWEKSQVFTALGKDKKSLMLSFLAVGTGEEV